MNDQSNYRHVCRNILIDYSHRPYIMGILNVTPDSFSDGGKYYGTDAAIERGLQMFLEGADFVDVGGESTRPGSERVSEEEEKERILPVIEGILKQKQGGLISVDTYKSTVADSALELGAVMINDVTCFRFDVEMAGVISRHNATAVLMHMRGEPKNMQDNPVYTHVISEIETFLTERIQYAVNSGIRHILVDPGIGFGKRTEDNLEILRSLDRFNKLGYPVLVGASRKSFIGNVSGLAVEKRLEGSLAAASIAVLNGASMIRTHDITSTKRAVEMAFAVRKGSTYVA